MKKYLKKYLMIIVLMIAAMIVIPYMEISIFSKVVAEGVGVVTLLIILGTAQTEYNDEKEKEEGRK